MLKFVLNLLIFFLLFFYIVLIKSFSAHVKVNLETNEL